MLSEIHCCCAVSVCFYYRSLCFVCRLYFFCRFCLCRLFSHTQNKHRPIHTYVCAYVGLESWIGRRRSTEGCRVYGRARRNRVIHLLIGNSWGILTFSGLFLVCPLLRVPLPPLPPLSLSCSAPVYHSLLLFKQEHPVLVRYSLCQPDRRYF